MRSLIVFAVGAVVGIGAILAFTQLPSDPITARVLGECAPDAPGGQAADCAAVTTDEASPVTTTATPETVLTSEPATSAVPETSTASAPAAAAPADVVPADAQFFEDFSTPESMDRFEFQIHDPIISTRVETWHADHSMECDPPSAPGAHPDASTRLVHQAVAAEQHFYCAPKGPETGHMMTSVSSAEYAHLDFSPKETFEDVTRVCWNMNQTDMGQRKWINVFVVPADDIDRYDGELRYIAPGFDVAGTDFWNGQKLPTDGFMMSMLDGSAATFVGPTPREAILSGSDWNTNFDGFRVADKARRFKHCMTDLGNGYVRMETEKLMPDGSPWITGPGATFGVAYDLVGAFPDGEVRVGFQDITYDNQLGHVQSCRSSSLADSGSTGCGNASEVLVDPEYDNTWHWDDISVS